MAAVAGSGSGIARKKAYFTKKPTDAKWLFLLFASLVFAKIFITFAMNGGPPGPLCFDDELVYKENAWQVFNAQQFQMGQNISAYPPLYPILLAPAFFFGDGWYAAMILINILASSAIIFPVWLISREMLPEPASFVPVGLAALLPFHAVFPVILLAENLSVLVFLSAFYVALARPGGGRLSGLLLGMACALAYLTKHLFLPAIPVLFALWWLGPKFGSSSDARACLRKLRLDEIVVFLAGFFAAYGPWLAYAHFSGITVSDASGASMILSSKTMSYTVGGLLFWAMAYASYLILAVAPFLGVFLAFAYLAVRRNVEISNREKLFFAAVIAFAAICLVVATQHSWRAGYNYPVPRNVVGRYMVHLAPLFLVAAVLAFSKVWGARRSLGAAALFSTALLSGLLAYSAYGILNRSMIMQLPASFAYSPFNAIDTFMYYLPQVLWCVVGIIFAIAALVFIERFLRAGRKQYALALILLLAVGFQSLILCGSFSRMAIYSQWPIHARVLADVFKEDVASGVTSLGVVHDTGEHQLTNVYIGKAMRFWDVPSPNTSVRSLTITEADKAESSLGTTKWYLLTRDRFDAEEIRSYEIRGEHYYLYEYAGVLGRAPLNPVP